MADFDQNSADYLAQALAEMRQRREDSRIRESSNADAECPTCQGKPGKKACRTCGT